MSAEHVPGPEQTPQGESPPGPPTVLSFLCGPLANNVYLVAGAEGRAMAVDPGIGAQEVILAALARGAGRST